MFKILVIDDDPDIIEFVRAVMPHEDYAISAAGGSIEAQSKISRQKFDAILLDIGLPGDDGISLLKFLQSTGITDFTPVIMITATANKEIVLTCRKHGASGFLMKPLKQKTLVDQMVRSISMRDIQMQKTDKTAFTGRIRIGKDNMYTTIEFDDQLDVNSVKEAFLSYETANEKDDHWDVIALDLRTQNGIPKEPRLLLKMLAKALAPASIYILAGHNYGELIGAFPEDLATLVISEIDLRRLLRQRK